MEDDYLGPTSASPDRLPEVLSERYELGRPLGRGAFGSVFRALDRLTGEDVVVKVSLQESPTEVTALLGARLPGVVRVLDQGRDGRWLWIAMERVRGEPLRRWNTWKRARSPVSSLLQALDRLHGAGAMHLDLKPENVLVTAAGQCVLVDLGLARGEATGDFGPVRRVGGNRHYSAPEQRAGGPVGTPADVYAVGVLLGEMLPADAPPSVVATAREMCSVDPEARPSAWSALERMGLAPEAPDFGSLLPLDVELEVPALIPLFWGPRRVVDVPGELARASLDGSTTREAVLARWTAWWRRGWVHLAGGRIRVLEPGFARIEARVRGGGAFGALVDLGDGAGALAVLQGELRASRTRLQDVRTLLGERIPDLVPLVTLEQLRVLHWEIRRCGLVGGPAEGIVRSAILVRDGDVDRAHRLLVDLGSDLSASLLRAAAALRMRAVQHRSLGERRAELETVGAGLPDADDCRGMLLDWKGRLEYAAGNFTESAIASEQGATLRERESSRLASLLNAASSWLEAGDPARCKRMCEAVLAADASSPRSRLRADWLARVAAYRSGLAVEPDLELVEAASWFGDRTYEGLIALNEAGVSWRAGLAEDARQLAQRATLLLSGPAQRLASALELFLSVEDAFEAAKGLAEHWEAHPDVVDWQGLSLLAWRTGRSDWMETARRRCPEDRSTERRDLLAPDEILGSGPPAGAMQR